jgi:putative oxidoreductase
MMNKSQPGLLIPPLGAIYAALNPICDPLIRVVAGLWLIPHGCQKLFGFGAGPNSPVGFDALSQAFEKYMGLPGFLGPLSALIEFVGGIFLVLGFLTRPVAAICFVEFLVIVFAVHLPHGFFSQGGGFEYPLMWCLLFLVVAIRGGGRWSIDRFIGREF